MWSPSYLPDIKHMMIFTIFADSSHRKVQRHNNCPLPTFSAQPTFSIKSNHLKCSNRWQRIEWKDKKALKLRFTDWVWSCHWFDPPVIYLHWHCVFFWSMLCKFLINPFPKTLCQHVPAPRPHYKYEFYSLRAVHLHMKHNNYSSHQFWNCHHTFS